MASLNITDCGRLKFCEIVAPMPDGCKRYYCGVGVAGFVRILKDIRKDVASIRQRLRAREEA